MAARFAKQQRTEQDRYQDALRFIHGARPEHLLATEAAALCDRCGVKTRDTRRAVEAALLAAQDRERRRQA